MTREELINEIAKHAIKVARKDKVLFPSVTIAQYIIESGWKISDLARKHNNYFGVKASKDWKGKKVYMQTEEEKDGKKYLIWDWFRVYPSPEASFEDRTKFLKMYKRYKPVLAARTPQEQTFALQKAGYATASNYARALNSVIKDYNLERFDSLPDLDMSKYFWGGLAIISIILIWRAQR